MNMTPIGRFNFNEFYSAHYRRTFLFAKSYVHDEWAAEDIASEALIDLWETLKEHEIHQPLAYLLGIVKNRAIDYLRHEIAREEALAAMSEIGMRELNTRISTLEACEPEKIYSRDVEDIIESTLNSLPAKTCEIFRMSRYHNMTRNAIAVRLNMSSKGVEYHISTALAALRASLKDYLPLPLFCFMFFYR
ncbi:MAG: RNA polymerase sigma-70 factor [Tannerella sp.]|jgi:RNA polymerase sigma-70 factor (ECF subfamily)|nr:RNA polymerase sigma-70 factor [Tannerella sp.]